MGLSTTQRSALTRIRAVGNSILDASLDDDVCAYLISVIAADLGFSQDLPEVPANPPAFFSSGSMSDLRVPCADFIALYERSLSLRPDVDAYFGCLAKLHKAGSSMSESSGLNPYLPSIRLAPEGSFNMALSAQAPSSDSCFGENGYSIWTTAPDRKQDTCSSQ